MRIEREWKAAGLETDGLHESEFQFVPPGEESIGDITKLWHTFITEFGFDRVPVSDVVASHDGIGPVAAADATQIRQALAYQYNQIVNLETLEAQQQYWYDHPIIKAYLAMV